MKSIAAARRVKVSADGHGVVSHAGMGLLRELADQTGLSEQVTGALSDTYKGPWVYAPGAVFADLAAAVADGADCIHGVGQLCGDREHVFGAKASTTTMWRLVDERIDAVHLPKVRAARAAARATAWAGGAAPARGQPLCIDIDATLVIDHSDNKADAAPTWKKSFGHHPLLAFLDRPEIAGGEALAGLLRKGNAGSNTAADHVTVLDQALDSLPADRRPDPDAEGAPAVVVRCDTAGATHKFAQACRDRGVGFSFGFPVDARVWDAVDTLNLAEGWYPAIDAGGEIRDGAWVAEATSLVNLCTWPAGTRLVLRKERPHPGAQLRFTDIDGMRITAFITDTAPGVIPGQLAGLELRHRQHARVEDRIREAKAAGLANLPCHGFDPNAAWLEIVLAAADLVSWAQLIGFTDTPELARCEIASFRYRVLHAAARITRSARQLRLRIDATWRWATAIATAWRRIRAAFP
ncbi:transposase for insertion sequence ISMyma02 [Mycobacterium marinum M]|uniref:Transposase for insertion sequence ISMyma02 n=6 Tax=Mycobacterium marinum TaxID=1781 RepID=B2HFL0_MYCMM|nr:IS1380-like element ISMyma2 family transposase [Mycobacterium marinum]ACC39855.1 transposase for insertion sequence ISMyma02 [Mycobacterium marinum M]ACC39862.1 transposase for insertion sequence ISMyma02 [Mycobacterium marinum M]ACC39866.1 transposase for insertion sequence ISMyma02 [Mycobacterium marinum M]ACC39899.1 transposase for insertion sequence ISMyma02 [Mycobacterium marinum M]ACC39919.1 transposase for insertion sequence ISMyma02 [Mycobacterium marinum M]